MIRLPQTTPCATPEIAAAMQAGIQFSMLQSADELNRFLNWAVVEHFGGRPAVIVEIGSHKGGTSAAFCSIATDRMVSIDLPDGVGGGRSFESMQDRDRRLCERFPHYVSIYGDSHQVTTQEALFNVLAGDMVDLLFIDGDHSAQGVAADYFDYRNFVRPGGIIAFHDIAHSSQAVEEDFGVRPFWDSLVAATKRAFIAEIPELHGTLGIGALVVE